VNQIMGTAELEREEHASLMEEHENESAGPTPSGATAVGGTARYLLE
jgi:hypothetical protein